MSMVRQEEAPVTKRRFPRIKRRLSCEVSSDGQRRVGVVLNLSAGGFFVQTQANPAVGSKVLVHLRDPSDRIVDVPVRVASRHEIAPRLRSVARGGIGCALIAPPEEYFRLLHLLSA